MAMINQKEYLKKYLSGDKKGKKKKRRKNIVGNERVKIIDDDIDLSNVTTLQEASDLLNTNEDAPQVVGVFDERPMHLRIDDYRKSELWKPLGIQEINDSEFNNMIQANKSSNSTSSVVKLHINPSKNASERNKKGESPPRRNKGYSSSPRERINEEDLKDKRYKRDTSRSPERKIRRQDDSNSSRSRSDFSNSPPRQRNRRNSDSSPRRQKSRWDSSNSPTRDESNSPPLKIRRDSDGTPPSYKNKRDEDNSPPRKSKRDSDSSPQRHKSRRDEDNSPPRKSKRNSVSPPRYKNRRDDDDNSPPRPPRKNRRDSDKSPPRNNKRDADNSPPRRSRRNSDNSPPRQKYDNSPPRRNVSKDNKRITDIPKNEEPKRKLLPGNKKGKYLIPAKRDPNYAKMTKTLDGKTAGLQNVEHLIKENAEFRKREDELFKNMSSDISGANAAPIIRDRKTGKIRDLQKEAEERREKEKKDEENKAKYTRWGRGLKQVEDYEEKLNQDLHEMNKPLARYADDEDLERHLKEQEREGDPMLAYIRKKKRKKAVESGQSMKPQYQGADFLPNRFGIPPGHRWDGVDRSGGYEKKWFEVQNSKRAEQEEIYKWSTEDM